MKWSWAVGVYCVLLPLTALGGPEVEIETRDGTVYAGTVVTETKDAIVLRIKKGSITGQVTIPRKEIKQDNGPGAVGLPAELEAELAAARKLNDPAARAERLIGIASRIESDADPADAARVFQEAGRADPSRRDETDVAAARALTAGGERVEAERILREALERNPKNARARGAARVLQDSFEDKATEVIEPGVRAFLDQQPRRALRLLTDAAESLPRPVLDAASKRVQEKTGMTLPQIMVDCRLRARCRSCEGAGVVDCPMASSQANYRCKFGRRVHYGRIEWVGKERFTKWERCKKCDGLGHLNCKPCVGMGMHISRPTAYEREELLKVLGGEMRQLEERATKLTRRVESDERESSVRSVAASELLGLLREMRGYARSLSKLDAVAGARGGGNLRRAERATGKRMAAIMTALANALYVGGEQRYEDAVNYDSPLTDGAKFVSPAMRAIKARQAWEVVNQARIYTLEALELDPGSAGPTRGDLKRRLALMDRFLRRTWKTYLGLRAVEEKWRAADQDLDTLYMNILQGAAGGGGGGANESVSGGGSTRGGVKGKNGSANGKSSGGFKGKTK